MIALRLLAAALLTAVVLPAADTIRLAVDFSADGGRTWSTDLPVQQEPQPVQVRLRWGCDGPAEDVEMFYPGIAHAGSDFGSANRGKPPWDQAHRWQQCPVPSWIFPGGTEVVLTLDPRARAAGVQGYLNRWDAGQNKFVDGPLPACPALAPGGHTFAAEVGYRSKRTKQMVGASVPFTLTIGGLAALPAPAASAAAAPLPDMRAIEPRDQTPADQVLAVDALQPFAGGRQPERNQGFARGVEAVWRVSAAQAGSWHLTLPVAVHDNFDAALHSYEPWLYVNGRGVRLATHGRPWTVDGVGMFVELRSAEAVALAAGDEVRPSASILARRWLGGVGLHRNPPPRGIGDVFPYQEPEAVERWRPTVRVALPGDSTRPATAALAVVGAAGRRTAARARWQVLDYFTVVVAEGSEDIALASGEKWSRVIAFPWGASDRYRVVLGVDEPGARPVEAVGEALAEARWSELRTRRWLVDGWRFCGRGDGAKGMDAPPADGEAGLAVALPATWQSKGGKHRAGWLWRDIDAAGLPAGRRVLRFHRLPGDSALWIDGVKVATRSTHHAPFAVDVTAALAAPGPHRVAIAMEQGDVRSWAAESTRYCCEISLEVEPAAAVAEVQVRPSVRERSLALAVTATGAPAGAQVQAVVSHRGRPVLRLPAAALVAGGGATIAAPWADPVLWEPGRPELLRVDVELIDAGGNVLDRLPLRTGFKELWTDGPRLMLNGVPVKLRANAMDGIGDSDAWNQRDQIRSRVRSAIAYGSQMTRHSSHWDTGLDACDEEGLLSCTYVAWHVEHHQRNLDDGALWERLARCGVDNARALARHPSVGIWYLSNEFAETASDPALAVRRLVALGEAVRVADPTRLVEAGCDLDLRGWKPLISTHYPVDVGAFQAAGTYLPGGALWRPEGQPFIAGARVPAGQFQSVANVRESTPIAWGLKPILVGETGWNMFYGPPGGFAMLLGDDAYRGGASLNLAHYLANAWFIAGHRDAGASLITPWMQPYWGGCLDAIPLVDAWPWTRHAAWYAGEPVEWQVNLHHDRRAPSPGRFAWRLTAEDGRELASGGEDLQLQPAELRRIQLAFRAPEVAAATRGTLTVGLSTADGEGRPRRFPVAIHPRRPSAIPADGVGLFDPAGATAAAAAAIGWQPARLARIDAAALAGLRLLVIGEDAGGDAALIAGGAAVQEFASRGGAVLVLRQAAIDPAWAGTRFQVTGKRTSQPFIRAPSHPLLAGLADADLQFWFPDHLVSYGDLLKPQAGDFTVLTDAALGRVGQDYVQLLDWRVGQGRYLFCQMALAPRLGRQPVADLLLARMVAWSATDRHGHRPAVVASAAGSPVHRALRAAGLRIAAGDDPEAPLVIDAARAPQPGEVAAWRQRLEAGGRVLVHGVAAANQAWVGELVGRRVQAVGNTVADWRGRALRLQPHPLSDGIANADLFWRRNSTFEYMGATFCTDENVLAPLYDCALAVEGGQALAYPAVLVAVPVGKGTALLDTIRWESDETLVAPMARRLAATLCANLGASLESRRSRTWMTDLDMVGVDLSPFANRALADDKADDGAGGFSDQGPDCDLRSWPTGRQVRRGIPFTVHPERSAIVLASRFRPGNQPESVAIPIGRTARALFFLQTSAWTGRQHHASYLVRYGDGSQIEVPLIGGVNLFDWQGRYGDEVSAEETDTYTRYAGAVPVKACGQAGAFVMQWVNPEPQKAIAEVVFVSKRQGVPILMALTLGVDPAPVDTAPGDRARAEALRLEAKSATAPVEVLQRALAADPSHHPVRLDLAAAQLKAGDAEAAERTLRTAVRADRLLLQGYADLAQLLESQQRWAEAADVWKRSLAANPNQPQVYHALEADLKQLREGK